MITALARRPADCAMPKPVARALVGNTSEMKICAKFPASWMKKIITNPTTKNIASEVTTPNAAAARPASTNAATAVTFRPKRSSAYIMKPLAQGNASVMPSV